MVSYRSGGVVGARSILGRYLAGVLSIYELALIAAPLTAGCASLQRQTDTKPQ
jgi:hypothetical protein